MAASQNASCTLYDLSLKALVNGLYSTTGPALERIRKLPELPRHVLIDVYELMSQRESLKDTLLEELSCLKVFMQLLRYSPARGKLFRIVSSLVSRKRMLPSRLREAFVSRYTVPVRHKEANEITEDEQAIEIGFKLGSFLSEAGMQESISVLSCLYERLKYMPAFRDLAVMRVDCLQRLLHVETAYGNFELAQLTLDELRSQITDELPSQLIAMAYTQISALYFARNEYSFSQVFSRLAMLQLKTNASASITIDVLRQAAKTCVIEREYARANLLISQAVRRAREHFGCKHQKYGHTLLDYGFFLRNVDSASQSVKVYNEAVAVLRRIFGSMNFHVSIALEEMSFAYYLENYSTGDFEYSQHLVDEAIHIMKSLVPSNHLLLASSRRLRALILEEIAVEKITDGIQADDLLLEAEALHHFALSWSLVEFGETNVQTAKCYGNLGRLFQTMGRWEEAERMHLMAIEIKTDLLGEFDYEVGQSISHLASLYNYQMKKYRDAEQLYLRNIDISLRLFGDSYSGLVYDYGGLCHVYQCLYDPEKYFQYAHTLENWQLLREEIIDQNIYSYPPIEEDFSIEEVKYKYISMSANNPSNSTPELGS